MKVVRSFVFAFLLLALNALNLLAQDSGTLTTYTALEDDQIQA